MTVGGFHNRFARLLPAAAVLAAVAASFAAAESGTDRLGENELAAAQDPSFASVAKHFQPMKFPREVVGVPDGPHEIGVQTDGSLQYDDKPFIKDNVHGTFAFFEVGDPPVRWGDKPPCQKRLSEGYLPIVVARWEHEGLTYEQTILGWSSKMSADTELTAYVRLTIRNPKAVGRKIGVRFQVQRERERKPVETAKTWEVDLEAGGSRSVYVKLPYSKPTEAAAVDAAEFDARLVETTAFWKTLLSKGMKIRVPEQRVNDAYRAWLAYQFINADKIGGVYELHDGGGFYESVYGYAAALECHAFDLMGFCDESRRYLDSLQTFVAPDGSFILNFGVPDAGALLFALGEHFRLTGDEAWLRRSAPTMVKMCDWIIKQRKKSKAANAKDSPLYGLIEGRPYADHVKPAYSYLTDAYLIDGMNAAAEAFRRGGKKSDAAWIRADADAYRRDLSRSMERSALVRDGMKMLPVSPDARDPLFQAGNYDNMEGYYGLVAGMLLETDCISASGEPARLLKNFIERRCLLLGMCAFGDGIDHAYTYGYWHDCLGRDEVKRVLLGFYGSLAHGMSRETYAAVELARPRTGKNDPFLPHGYSNTQQLRLLRNMLIREHGNELLIGQAIPHPWLEHGKQVRVEGAPTLFGKTSFAIESRVDDGRIAVTIDPPTRTPAETITVRLRHPQGKPIKAATVDGKPTTAFTADAITLHGLGKRVVIDVHY